MLKLAAIILMKFSVPMKRRISILFAGHSNTLYGLGCRQLSAHFDLNPILVEEESVSLKACVDFQPDVIISEHAVSGFSGLNILRFIRETDTFLPFIIFTEQVEGAAIAESLGAGADDYVTKDQIYRLPFAVSAALEKAELHRKMQKSGQTVAESNAKYRAYLDSAPEGIIIFNREGYCIDANKLVFEKMGYTPEEIQKLHLKDIVTAKFREVGKKHFAAVQSNGEAYIETEIQKKDGKNTWVSVKGVALPDGNIMGFISDISERIAAQHALEASELRYRKLISEMDQGIALHEIILDEKGTPVNYRFIEMNKSFEKLTGLKKEECVGKTVLEVLPDLEKSWIKRYGKVALTGKPMSFEQYSTSLRRYYSITAYSPSKGQFATIFNDVTDKKYKDRELMQALEMRNLLFQTSNDGILILDKDHKVFDFNSRFAEMLGYRKAELLKMHSWDFDAQFDEKAIRLKFHITPEYSSFFESRHRRKDGTIYDVEISGKGISYNEQVYAVYICRDVTEKIKVRQALEEARAKAESGDRLKTSFLNNISHELRTPLNGIIGATSLLNDKMLGRQEISELMEIINLSTERLIQTITDYMDISQITSNTIEARSKILKVGDIVEKFKISYWQKCLDKNLTFNIELTEDTRNLYMEIDPELIAKSLGHLLQNALKFTHSGSITLGAEVSGDQIIFFVRDTGIGISKEKLKAVFEHFRQEDDSFARRFEGSGLGLSIVKGLTGIMGGTVDVESQKQKGTTVRLFFSKKSTEETEQKLEKAPLRSPKKEPVILIAEDEVSNFQMLAMLLHKSYKATVLHATNGLEALKMVKSNPEINLVLMDLKMPVMNGFESTSEIKKIRPELPVVAQTAFAMSSDESRAAEAGCDLYVPQPLSHNNIEQIMKRFNFEPFGRG